MTLVTRQSVHCVISKRYPVHLTSVTSGWKVNAQVIRIYLPQEMIKKAFGGILLVDEAYYLYNAANDKDYGQESIEILLNVMEEQKDDLIVTLAGCAFCNDL